MQKRAIIDVGDSFSWDIIAVERKREAAKHDTDVAIGKHFKNFLDVTLLLDNSTYTRKAIAQVNLWAKSEDDLHAPDIKARTVNYIDAHDEQNINMDEIKGLVCCHEDYEKSEALQKSFDNHMDNVELSGVQFTSRANSIPDSEKKTKVKTNNNVTVEWQGEMNSAGIKKSKTPDGKIQLIIEAEHVEYITK
jgi:hypothetical protein